MYRHVAEQLGEVRRSIPESVGLVAVSKFHPVEALRAAYEAGQRRFGESRVQELLAKIPLMHDDVEWHFIGHLQSNKVRQLIGKTALIESVDTERLLNLIDKESERAGVTTRVLLQLHVAREETKFGFSVEELEDYFAGRRFESLKATHICGLMGMASNTDDTGRITADFAAIARCYDKIRNDASLGLRGFDILSMGMSDDRDIAISQGSNMVRVGTAIFGAREY
ncbi:MAG: YggS family pyridoxal phosphate-dependent enzyme [Muribaculaceae bacterium]|nr:YggS family pyridoxal phosphate-dependent enzyme [Muribaculaceae bacterium]